MATLGQTPLTTDFPSGSSNVSVIDFNVSPSDLLNGPITITDNHYIGAVYFATDGFVPPIAVGNRVELVFYTPITLLTGNGMAKESEDDSLYDSLGVQAALQNAMNIAPALSNSGIPGGSNTNAVRDPGPLKVGLFLNVTGDSTKTVPFSIKRWQANTKYAKHDFVVDPNNHIQVIQSGGNGTSDSTEPTWVDDDSGNTTDGTVTWTEFGNLSLQSGTLHAVIRLEGSPTSKPPYPTSIVFSQQPVDTTTGTSFSVAVQVLDQDGDPFLYWPVSLIIDLPGPGSWFTFVTATDPATGIATIDNLSLSDAGTYNLLARPLSTEVEPILSDSFNVT